MKEPSHWVGSPLYEYFPVFDESTQEILLTPNTLADTLMLVPIVFKRTALNRIAIVHAFVIYFTQLSEVMMEEVQTNQEKLEKTKDEDKKKRKKFVNLSK